MAVRELSEAHGGDGDGARFAWWAREKQSEGEKARNGGSSDVASLFTPLPPDQPGQRRCTATTWCARSALVGHDVRGIRGY